MDDDKEEMKELRSSMKACKAYLYPISTLYALLILGAPKSFGLLIFQEFQLRENVFIFGLVIIAFFLFRYFLKLQDYSLSNEVITHKAVAIHRFLYEKLDEKLEQESLEDTYKFLDQKGTNLTEQFIRDNGSVKCERSPGLPIYELRELKPGTSIKFSGSYLIQWNRNRSSSLTADWREIESNYQITEIDFLQLKLILKKNLYKNISNRIEMYIPLLYPSIVLIMSIIYFIKNHEIISGSGDLPVPCTSN